MMGEKTGIAWCDHTFNPWIGCTKVSSGCQNCYAARDNNRYQWVKEWGKDYRLTANANWKKPIQWAKKAVADGVIRRVFCASLADVFDTKVPEMWRSRLWDLILSTDNIGGLEWLILTKRPENINDFMPDGMKSVDSIRMGVTTENQEVFDYRMDIFLDTWAGKNFISAEPLLGDIEISEYSTRFTGIKLIDWIIAGCESGSNARHCDIEWVRHLRDQSIKSEIPFFLKQMSIPIGGIEDEPCKGMKLEKVPYLDGKQWLEFPGAK